MLSQDDLERVFDIVVLLVRAEPVEELRDEASVETFAVRCGAAHLPTPEGIGEEHRGAALSCLTREQERRAVGSSKICACERAWLDWRVD